MNDLSPQGQQIYQIIQDTGDWINRAQLAHKIEKKALNKWHVAILDKLIEKGLIETRQVPHHGPIGFEWQYRAKKE